METLNAEEYLAAIIAKNPAIGRADDETITLKARGLRSLIQRAHQKGEEHGRRLQKIQDRNCDFLSGIFGGRK